MVSVPPPSGPSPDLPLQIGPAEAFARVRQFCHDAGFDEATLCRVLSVKRLDDCDRLDWETVDLDAQPAALHWCIDVFFRGIPAPEAQSRVTCGDAVFAALFELGLLRPALHRQAMVICPVWLYPVDDFLITSDRRDDAAGAVTIAGDDVVFPALDIGTIRFLRFMPDARGGDALDLCGGCGVGALHLTRTAGHVITIDVTSRSTAFAAFNAHLNGVRATSLCGDLYAPVQNQRFDLITAHPPYVPTYGRAYVFRDGGDTGEIIIRRIVEGLPEYLRPGGTAMLICAGRDATEDTFEQRVKAWLGAAATDFDMIFGLIRSLSIDEIVQSLQSRSQPMTPQEALELRTRLAELGTRQFAYGALLLRRSSEPVNDPPLRIDLTDAAVPADFDRLLDWRAFRRQAAFKPWLAAARPRFAPDVELISRYAADDGRLAPAEFTFRSGGTFQSALRLDFWIAPVLATFDGQRSTKDVFDAAHQADELPEAFAFSDFANLVGLMIELGILDVTRSASAQ